MGKRSLHRSRLSTNGTSLLIAVGVVSIGLITTAVTKALGASTIGLGIGVIVAGVLGATFVYWILSRRAASFEEDPS